LAKLPAPVVELGVLIFAQSRIVSAAPGVEISHRRAQGGISIGDHGKTVKLAPDSVKEAAP